MLKALSFIFYILLILLQSPEVKTIMSSDSDDIPIAVIKKRRVVAVESSSEDEENLPQVSDILQTQNMSFSSDEDESNPSVFHLVQAELEVLPDEEREELENQSASALNFSSLQIDQYQCVKDIFESEENIHLLDSIAGSKYAMYKLFRRTERSWKQDIQNIVAVNLQMSQADQRAFQSKFLPIYNGLKFKGFPVEEILPMVEEALQHIGEEEAERPTLMVENLQMKQTKISSFFTRSDGASPSTGPVTSTPSTSRTSRQPSTSGSLRAASGTSTPVSSRKSRTPANLPQLSPVRSSRPGIQPTSRARSSSDSGDGEERPQFRRSSANTRIPAKYFDKFQEALGVNPVVEGFESDIFKTSAVNKATKKIVDFTNEVYIYKQNRKFQKTSELADNVNGAEKFLEKLKQEIIRFSTLASDGNRRAAEESSVTEKMKIYQEVKEKQSSIENTLSLSILEIADPKQDFHSIVTDVKQRNSRMRSRQKKLETKKNNTADFNEIEAVNAHRSWNECLEEIEERESDLRYNGTSVSFEEVVEVYRALREGGFLSKVSCLDTLDRPDPEWKNLKHLLVHNVPIICVRKGKFYSYSIHLTGY